MEGRSPADVYFCESPGTASILAQAGLGICILPFPLTMQMEPDLCHIPIEGIAPVCYGLYYKSLDGNEPLKRFVRLIPSTADATIISIGCTFFNAGKSIRRKITAAE